MRARLVAVAAAVIVAAVIAWRVWPRTAPSSGGDAAAVSDLAAAPAAADGGEARRGALAGRVVDRHGRAAPGAELELGSAVLAPPSVKRQRAGADGNFLFSDLPDGAYALRATRAGEAAFLDGLRVAFESSPDGGVGGAPRLTVGLAPAIALAGKLRERGGRPLAGGEVALLENGSEAAALLARRMPTADNGGFRFDAVLPGAYLVLARAAGFVPSGDQTLNVGAAPPPLELRLDRGALVEGRVLDEDAHPVPGAQVEIAGEGEGGAPIAVTSSSAADWPRAAPTAARLELAGELGILRGPIPFPPSRPLLPAAPARSFLTDARAGFRIAGLPPGKLVVAASHPDFARGASQPLAFAPGATVTVEVVLRRGRTLHGRVIDERGAPLAGAELVVDGRALTVSDGRGEWQLAHQVGELELGARLAGYLPRTRTAGADETEVELQLQRADGRLGGVVVDDRGFPVAAARLQIFAGELPPRALTTDRAGAFHADGLGPAPYRLRVEHADFAPLDEKVAAPTDELRVELPAGGGVSGELRDARSGGVPAGARLTIEAGGATRALSLTRGRFETTALAAGRATLRATAPGYVPWSRELDVPAGERPREVTVRDLEVELVRGGAVAGTVLDEEGQPLPSAQLSSGAARARSDARGEFKLEGLPAGRARVRAEAGGKHAEEEVEVRADEESHVDLRLR